MSDYVKGLVWNSPRIQNHADLLVMLAIADSSDDSGEAVPTMEEIASKCRMAERSVYRIRNRMREEGLLKWVDTRVKDSPRCVYSLQIRALTLTHSQGAHPDPQSGCPPTTLTHSQGDHPDPQSGSYIYNNIITSTKKDNTIEKRTPSKKLDTDFQGDGASSDALPTQTPAVPTPSPNKRAARPAFRAPSLDDVRTYVKAQDLPDFTEDFLDYYEANGWVQGKARKPIKSWEAAYRQWCRRAREFGQAPKTEKSTVPFGMGYKLQPFR